MEFYIQIEENSIINIDTENSSDTGIQIIADNIDELYDKVKEYGGLSEEIEEQVKSYFEKTDSVPSIAQYQIKHWTSNRSFGELIDMYENGEIQKPDMQRSFVWDAQKSSRLIESIILGLPIPPLFFLEVDNNKYEVIDGFQRLTTITNYVMERPWGGEKQGRKKVAARLSGNISEELRGKKFGDLSPDYRRIIKRSTIPLIEFRQIGPKDTSSKYLIFERINTGSEKLNSMQIRKSLAYGEFMKSLYEQANSCEELKGFFSPAMLLKDVHVEALLRIYTMSRIYYKNEQIDKSGMNNILNMFCENNRNQSMEKEYNKKVNQALIELEKVFDGKNNMFRRVIKGSEGNLVYTGNVNVSIMEAMVGVVIEKGIRVNPEVLRTNYKKEMSELYSKSVRKEAENPFSTSTGASSSIKKRFQIAERIIGVN